MKILEYIKTLPRSKAKRLYNRYINSLKREATRLKQIQDHEAWLERIKSYPPNVSPLGIDPQYPTIDQILIPRRPKYSNYCSFEKED